MEISFSSFPSPVFSTFFDSSRRLQRTQLSFLSPSLSLSRLSTLFSSSHLSMTMATSDAQDKCRQKSSLINAVPPSLPRTDGSSNLLHPSSSPALPAGPTAKTKTSKYFYYVNLEPTRKASITTTSVASVPPPSTAPSPTSTSHLRRKLSGISLQVPWYKRARTPSDDKLSTKQLRMSRDRLLPLERLFSHPSSSSGSAAVAATTTTTADPLLDDEQNSPVNDRTPLASAVQSTRPAKENGFLHHSSQLKTR